MIPSDDPRIHRAVRLLRELTEGTRGRDLGGLLALVLALALVAGAVLVITRGGLGAEDGPPPSTTAPPPATHPRPPGALR